VYFYVNFGVQKTILQREREGKSEGGEGKGKKVEGLRDRG